MARTAKRSAVKRSTVKKTAKNKADHGSRWTDAEVKVLLEEVNSASTAKAGFVSAAKKLNKNIGTVQQKYYNLKKKSGGAARKRVASKPVTKAAAPVRASRTTARTTRATKTTKPVAVASKVRSTEGLPSTVDLRATTIDELVALANRVKVEVDRRQKELGAASKLFK